MCLRRSSHNRSFELDSQEIATEGICSWTCLQFVKYLGLHLDQKVRVSPSFSHQESYRSNSNFRPFNQCSMRHLDYILAKTASSSATGIALPSEKNLKKILTLQLEAHKSTLHYLFPQMKNSRDLTALKFRLTLFWQAT